jgi:SAM-dependent methyltransferase
MLILQLPLPRLKALCEIFSWGDDAVKKKESRPIAPRWLAFDVAEGFFLGHALFAIEKLGILDSLKKPALVGDLALRHQVDKHVLDATLQMLATRTVLIRYHAGKYKATSHCNWLTRFYLLLYVGAYGPNARELASILQDPRKGTHLVGREQYKRAYEQLKYSAQYPLIQLILQLRLNQILDLGCGTANMLHYLASHRENFVGWGIDSSIWMCEAARRKIAQAKQSDRIKIIHGNSCNPKGTIPSRISRSVRALTATGIANEFFMEGISGAVTWLANLKKVFPGRIMLISDYYGQLGFRRRSLHRGAALHDFAQVISAQGVPPPDLKGWKKVYEAANCKFIRTVEEKDAPNPNFVHMLKL